MLHFIIKINIDVNNSFRSNEIISHTNLGITIAKKLLEKETRSHVSLLTGNTTNLDFIPKIVDIHSFDQVAEPIIDTVIIYRLDSNPHRLHVYQRKSIIVPARGWGQKAISEFRKICIFELNEYACINTDIHDIVRYGKTNIHVPEILTTEPVQNLLSSIKKCSGSFSSSELKPKTNKDSIILVDENKNDILLLNEYEDILVSNDEYEDIIASDNEI